MNNVVATVAKLAAALVAKAANLKPTTKTARKAAHVSGPLARKAERANTPRKVAKLAAAVAKVDKRVGAEVAKLAQ